MRNYIKVHQQIILCSGIVKAWDPKGRVLSVEVELGEFALNQPVFGLQSNAFGEIHDFDRSVANFTVSPIATATAEFKRTTGILDLNDQRIYDSDRYQEFSYVVNSPINVRTGRTSLRTLLTHWFQGIRYTGCITISI